MFWHIDERQYNVDELVNATDTMVEKAQERGVSLQDADALREAKKHMWVTRGLSWLQTYLLHRILAANDKLWREVQTSSTPEVPFVTSGISHRLSEVWAELQSRPPMSQDQSPISFLMSPLRLVKLREVVSSRPFIDEVKLVLAGHEQVKEEQARNSEFLQSVRKKTKGAKKRVVEENVRETRKAEEAARQRHDKVLEMQNELRLVTEKQAPKYPASTPQNDKHPTVLNRSSAFISGIPMSKTPLTNARVVTSKSSKLNYLLKEA
jgi:hypothetical protein